jgi:hypothetical protein
MQVCQSEVRPGRGGINECGTRSVIFWASPPGSVSDPHMHDVDSQFPF